jgi:hypothetical protein
MRTDWPVEGSWADFLVYVAAPVRRSSFRLRSELWRTGRSGRVLRAGLLAEIVRKVTNATPRAGYLAEKEVFSSKGTIFRWDGFWKIQPFS